MDDAAPIETKNDETVENSECNGVYGEEIDRGDVVEMVIDEPLPGLWVRMSSANSVLPDRRLGHMDTQ